MMPSSKSKICRAKYRKNERKKTINKNKRI